MYMPRKILQYKYINLKVKTYVIQENVGMDDERWTCW